MGSDDNGAVRDLVFGSVSNAQLFLLFLKADKKMAGMAAKLFEHPFGTLRSPEQLTNTRPRQGPPAEPADRPPAVVHGSAGLLQEDREERGLPRPVCCECPLCLDSAPPHTSETCDTHAVAGLRNPCPGIVRVSHTGTGPVAEPSECLNYNCCAMHERS